jgi:hypothetical protein
MRQSSIIEALEGPMKLHERVFLAGVLIATFAGGHAYALCVASTSVSGSAMQTGAMMWTYNFSVQNGCNTVQQPFLTDFYVPYFADAGIANIMLPPPDTTSTTSTITWTDTIEANNNLFGLAGAGVIDFQVTATPEIQVTQSQNAPGVGYYFASGFSFTSTFAPVEGPWAILQSLPPNYVTTTTLFGDPSIPGSPDTIAALGASAVPEPGTTTLVLIGLCLTTLVLRRRCKGVPD